MSETTQVPFILAFLILFKGITSSRGTRNHNEDRYRAVTLELLTSSHMQAMRRDANRAYFGVFDG